MGITGKDHIFITEVSGHLEQAMLHRGKAIEVLQKAAASGQVSDVAIMVISTLHVAWERAIKDNSLEDLAKAFGIDIHKSGNNGFIIKSNDSTISGKSGEMILDEFIKQFKSYN